MEWRTVAARNVVLQVHCVLDLWTGMEWAYALVGEDGSLWRCPSLPALHAAILEAYRGDLWPLVVAVPDGMSKEEWRTFVRRQPDDVVLYGVFPDGLGWYFGPQQPDGEVVLDRTATYADVNRRVVRWVPNIRMGEQLRQLMEGENLHYGSGPVFADWNDRELYLDPVSILRRPRLR